MPLSIIGAGLGRTGTLSVKAALEQLGFGPCFHSLEGPVSLIERTMSLALDRRSIDWGGIFAGYNAGVDIPFSWLYRDIADKHPAAKFILTLRDANAWFDSAQAMGPHLEPVERALPTFDWAAKVAKLPSSVIPPGLVEVMRFQDRESAIAGFGQFNAAVQKAIPADRLLVFDVKSGWPALCGFLGVPIPDTPFPHRNSTQEFPSLLRCMVERAYSGKTPEKAAP